MFFLWLNLLYWMRFFESTAHYVRMVVVTFSDILYFLLIQLIFMFTFGFTLFFINVDRIRGAEDPDAVAIITARFDTGGLFDMFLNQYLLLLGEFDLDNFEAGRYIGITWIVFGAATLVSQVVIFNMLIAIMGDSYAKISEQRAQAALKEKIQILCDYLLLIRDIEVRENYLVLLKPNEENDDSWGGILQSMKKNLQKTANSINSTIYKRIAVVSQDNADLKQGVANLSEKLENVTSSMQGLDERSNLILNGLS